MHQPLTFSLLVQLLLDRQKNLGLDALQLKLAVPSNPVADQNFVTLFDVRCARQQAQVIGQLVVHARTDFGQQHVAGMKSDTVPGRRDFGLEYIMFPFKLPDGADFQQLRMNGTLEQVQTWLGDFGTNG